MYVHKYMWVNMYMLYTVPYTCGQGRNWLILRGGADIFIINRKVEIIHGLSPGVKCVAPLFRDQSMKFRRGRAPPAPPPVAPLHEG